MRTWNLTEGYVKNEKRVAYTFSHFLFFLFLIFRKERYFKDLKVVVKRERWRILAMI